MRVDDVVVLHDSNRLALRLLPCDVLARVAHMEGKGGAEFEVEVARRLAETGSPVASLDPRVVPRVYARDGRGYELLRGCACGADPRRIANLTALRLPPKFHDRTLAICSGRRTGCCSRTWKPVAEGLSSSTSPIYRKR